MAKVAIIGSCVTRDVWRIAGHVPDFYVARTSFISMMNPAARRDLSDLRFTCNFMRECVERDNDGSTIQALLASQPDVLVIDFIEERYDVIRFGSSYLLWTGELSISGAEKSSAFADGELIDRNSAECWSIWLSAMTGFVRWMSLNLPNTRVVLHRAPWASNEIDEEYLGRSIPRLAPAEQLLTMKKTVPVHLWARITEAQNNAFLSAMPTAISIAADPRLHVRSNAHCWGPAPFHYVSDYYLEVAEKLSRYVAINPCVRSFASSELSAARHSVSTVAPPVTSATAA